MLLAGILVTWALVVVAFLFVWARLHEVARFQDGIDEEAYVNGWDVSRPSTRAQRLNRRAQRFNRRTRHVPGRLNLAPR